MTLFHHYYQPDTDPAVVAMAVADWCAALGGMAQVDVDAAFGDWIRDRDRRPTPGEVRALAVRAAERRTAASRRALPPHPEPERERCSPEAAARILAEAGLTPARIAAVRLGKRMPPPGRHGAGGPEAPPPPPDEWDIARRPVTAEQVALTRRLHGLAGRGAGA